MIQRRRKDTAPPPLNVKENQGWNCWADTLAEILLQLRSRRSCRETEFEQKPPDLVTVSQGHTRVFPFCRREPSPEPNLQNLRQQKVRRSTWLKAQQRLKTVHPPEPACSSNTQRRRRRKVAAVTLGRSNWLCSQLPAPADRRGVTGGRGGPPSRRSL